MHLAAYASAAANGLIGIDLLQASSMLVYEVSTDGIVQAWLNDV